MISEGADACGAGAGDACFAGLGAGAGLGAAAALGVTAGAGCLLAAGAFELLPPPPPQAATPAAVRKTAAAVARKVIGLLRFMVLLRWDWDQGGSPAPGRLSSAGGRHLGLHPVL